MVRGRFVDENANEERAVRPRAQSAHNFLAGGEVIARLLGG